MIIFFRLFEAFFSLFESLMFSGERRLPFLFLFLKSSYIIQLFFDSFRVLYIDLPYFFETSFKDLDNSVALFSFIIELFDAFFQIKKFFLYFFRKDSKEDVSLFTSSRYCLSQSNELIDVEVMVIKKPAYVSNLLGDDTVGSDHVDVGAIICEGNLHSIFKSFGRDEMTGYLSFFFTNGYRYFFHIVFGYQLQECFGKGRFAYLVATMNDKDIAGQVLFKVFYGLVILDLNSFNLHFICFCFINPTLYPLCTRSGTSSSKSAHLKHVNSMSASFSSPVL